MKTMKMLRNGLMFGALGLAAACGGSEPTSSAIPAELLECRLSPTVETQDSTNGTGGSNGLDAYLFHKYFNEMFAAMNVALTTAVPPPGQPFPVNPQIATGLLAEGADRDARKAMFEHAIQCALPTNTTLIDAEMETYTGKSLLKTTGGWLQNGLGEAARDDLFTCMSILLNPVYQGVPVFLSGPSVHECARSTPDYIFEEAIWRAEVTEVGVIYHVWPLFTGEDLPGCRNADELKDAFTLRVCGESENHCLLDVRELGAAADECEAVLPVADGTCGPTEGLVPGANGGHFKCAVDGGIKKKAIQSRLKDRCDLFALYCPSPM